MHDLTESIGDVLTRSKTLNELKLSRFNFKGRSSDFESIARGLQKSLSVTTITFVRCNFDLESYKCLQRVLQESTTVNELKLHEIDQDDKLASSVVNDLLTSNTLERLEILDSFSFWSPESVRALEFSTSLVSLHLDDMGYMEVDAFVKILPNLMHLRSLQLYSEYFYYVEVPVLVDALRRNGSLLSVTVYTLDPISLAKVEHYSRRNRGMLEYRESLCFRRCNDTKMLPFVFRQALTSQHGKSWIYELLRESSSMLFDTTHGWK
jgi:hypothetical protein